MTAPTWASIEAQTTNETPHRRVVLCEKRTFPRGIAPTRLIPLESVSRMTEAKHLERRRPPDCGCCQGFTGRRSRESAVLAPTSLSRLHPATLRVLDSARNALYLVIKMPSYISFLFADAS
jgi:hypothetical protein